jgi:hypothetical protein
MVRGAAKGVSQQKNAQKLAAKEKSKPRDAAASAAIKEAGKAFTCSVCMIAMPSKAVYKQHFENKHPKNALPADLQD